MFDADGDFFYAGMDGQGNRVRGQKWSTLVLGFSLLLHNKVLHCDSRNIFPKCSPIVLGLTGGALSVSFLCGRGVMLDGCW